MWVRTRRPTAVLVSGLALFGLLALFAAGCASNNSEVDSLSATYGLPSTRIDLEAEDWVLVPAKSSLTTDDDSPVTIAFDDELVSGIGPCNNYRGDLDLDDDSVEISRLATTTRACRDAVMEAEDEYLTALEAVDAVDVTDDRLELTNDDGVRLRYRAVDARGHLIGTWPVVNVATSDAIESVLTGTKPAVTFDEDGTLKLVTGCNDAHGDWTLEDDELTVDPLRQTKKLCSDPDGIMSQKASLARALESATRVQVAPRKLTLLNSGGQIVPAAAAGTSA